MLVGRKNKVTSSISQAFAITLQGAGVTVKVFVWCELQSVDEYASHHRQAVGFGMTHQGEVPFMQIPHGGNKRASARYGQDRTQLGKGVDQFHGVRSTAGDLLMFS